VTIVIRGEELTASMSQYLIDRIARQPAITIVSRSAVREVDGAGRLEHVTVEDLTSSAHRTIEAAALFVLIGAEAHTHWLPESIVRDSRRFIVTGPDLSSQARNTPAWQTLGRDPYLVESSLPRGVRGQRRSQPLGQTPRFSHRRRFDRRSVRQ
jgi:thioredoxin reductase (NADPH)